VRSVCYSWDIRKVSRRCGFGCAPGRRRPIFNQLEVSFDKSKLSTIDGASIYQVFDIFRLSFALYLFKGT
jgi:hypothetical protein